MKIGSEREILPRIISHLNTCELPAHGSFVGGLEIGYPSVTGAQTAYDTSSLVRP